MEGDELNLEDVSREIADLVCLLKYYAVVCHGTNIDFQKVIQAVQSSKEPTPLSAPGPPAAAAAAAVAAPKLRTFPAQFQEDVVALQGPDVFGQPAWLEAHKSSRLFSSRLKEYAVAKNQKRAGEPQADSDAERDSTQVTPPSLLQRTTDWLVLQQRISRVLDLLRTSPLLNTGFSDGRPRNQSAADVFIPWFAVSLAERTAASLQSECVRCTATDAAASALFWIVSQPTGVS
jgi:hypothetical protein